MLPPIFPLPNNALEPPCCISIDCAKAMGNKFKLLRPSVGELSGISFQ